MRGVFDDGELEPIQQRRDTELTLNMGTLLGLFLGLVLVCGLCFGLGYTVGRHHSEPTSAPVPQPASEATEGADTQAPLTAEASHPKPSAVVQSAVVPAQQNPGAAQQDSADSNPVPAAQSNSSASQPQARPALPAANSAPKVAQFAAESNAHAAAASSGPLMVQIAAVSQQEDAEVLVTALRRRGFAVVARRDGADGLIHVRIGPFTNRNDAYATRQRLLNDGYNAILQP